MTAWTQHHLEPGLPQHTAQLPPQYQVMASAASHHNLAQVPQPSVPVAVDVHSKSSPLASVPSSVPVGNRVYQDRVMKTGFIGA